MRLPSGTIHLPPGHTQLPYGFHMALVVPIWCMQILHGTIHLPYGDTWLPYGAHCSDTVPAPMWPPCSGCNSCIVSRLSYGSRSSHMAICGSCGSYMELLYGSILLPYGSIGLPYGTHGSHTAHTTPIWPPVWIHAAPIWCHLPPKWHHLAPTWLPYGTHGSRMVHMAPAWSPHSACGSHLAPSASNMATSGSHMVPTAPIQCQLQCGPHAVDEALIECHPPPIWCTQLPYDPVWCMWLLYGTAAAYTSHMAPMWHMWLSYSTHHSHIRPPFGSHAAPIWRQLPPIWHHLTPTWLPYGTHGSSMVHMAPAWSPHSACGSHMAQSASNTVHTAPIQCTQLSYGPHMSCAAPTQCHLTPIHCLRLWFCACGSHNGRCNSRMVPSSFQLVESGSQKAPIQRTWLPYGTHTSQMAPSASHMAPIQVRSSRTYQHAAPIKLHVLKVLYTESC
jgi:hypothetical protein